MNLNYRFMGFLFLEKMKSPELLDLQKLGVLNYIIPLPIVPPDKGRSDRLSGLQNGVKGRRATRGETMGSALCAIQQESDVNKSVSIK